MRTKIKKITALIIVGLFCLQSSIFALQIASADDTDTVTTEAASEDSGSPSTEEPSDPSYNAESGLDDLGSFNINTYLDIGEDQEQRYLNDTSNSPIMSFILGIINFLSQVIGVFAIALIIIGGTMMVISQGDDNRLQKGKTIVGQALIGLVIALCSYIIVTFVQSLLYVSS